MRYSVGTFVGLPIVAVLLLSLTDWLIAALVGKKAHSGDRKARKRIALYSVAGIIVTLAVFTVAWWPFAWDYHRWSPVEGTVSNVDAGLGDAYLISFEHTGQQYRCDDIRCAGTHVGESLHLSCIREFQYASLHGYTCRYAGS